MDIKYYQSNPNWKPSYGEKLDKIHFRNGHHHVECDPTTGICSVHYDEHDPSESLSELARHVWKSKLGKAIVVGFGVLAACAVLKK